MAKPHPLLYIHPIVTSVLALAYAGVGLLDVGGPPADLGDGQTVTNWFLVVMLISGGVGLTLTAVSSWQLLRAEGQEIVDGPLRLARMARWWVFGMLVSGPAIVLAEVIFTGAWIAMALAIVGGGCIWIPCALMLVWQFKLIQYRRFG